MLPKLKLKRMSILWKPKFTPYVGKIYWDPKGRLSPFGSRKGKEREISTSPKGNNSFPMFLFGMTGRE